MLSLNDRIFFSVRRLISIRFDLYLNVKPVQRHALGWRRQKQAQSTRPIARRAEVGQTLSSVNQTARRATRYTPNRTPRLHF